MRRQAGMLLGASLLALGCPRQGAVGLGPGDDGQYSVSLELSHPGSAELLLDEETEVFPERWTTVERVQRRPTVWSNGQPVQFAEEGQSVELRLTPVGGRQLSVEIRYSFHSPQPFSGSQAVVLAAEQLRGSELRLADYRLRLDIEP